jgi:D-inositol-3-phosphate glycosyltransferase
MQVMADRRIGVRQSHDKNDAIQYAATRVLIVSAYASPHIGGVEVVVGQQARTLAALGHDVTIATSSCGADGSEGEEIDGYRIIRFPAWNGLEERGGVPFPIWSPSAVWRLSRLVRDADIVHIHDVHYGSSVLAASLARRHRRSIFITQHVGVVEHDKKLVKLVQRFVYFSAGKMVWRWAETITVYNPIVDGLIRSHGLPAEKIRMTYNGIDTGYFRPGMPKVINHARERYGLRPDVPIVLFVGRLVPKKGFQKLVEARSPEYEVVLVGPGPIPSFVPGGVRFLGPLGRTDLRELYQVSDIFAFPAAGEMLTLAMQEAMACGLPVVAAAEDAYSGYGLDPSGIALIEPEPEVLRSTFLQILGDPARAKYMRTYSRWLAEERFDWWRNGMLHAAQYETVSGTPPLAGTCVPCYAEPLPPTPSQRTLEWTPGGEQWPTEALAISGDR